MSPYGNSKVGAAYDFIAPEYDALMEPDMRMRQALWRHHAHIFHSGDRVLDFGCGTGIDAVYLGRLGIRVTGIDASAGMIYQLRKKSSAERLPIEAHVGALPELQSMTPGSFPCMRKASS